MNRQKKNPFLRSFHLHSIHIWFIATLLIQLLVFASFLFFISFQDTVHQAVIQVFAVFMLSTLVIWLLTVWIIHDITQSVTTLSKSAETMITGDFTPIFDDGRMDELGKLNRSFNKMGYRLTAIVSNLEEEVVLRTRELQRRNDELNKLSFSDGLTGIANRRLFDDSIASAWEEALSQQRSIALYMIDIDYFKRYNDTYGHQAGDDCLRAVGQLLSQKARRTSDLAARYGGEEFVILMREVNPQNVYTFAQTLQQAVEAMQIKHETSPFGYITISLGMACVVPNPHQTASFLIEMADTALYRAKHSGRNKISN